MLTNIIIPHGIANLHDASEFMEFVKLREEEGRVEKDHQGRDGVCRGFAKGRVAPDSQFVHLTITKPHKEGTNEMSSNSQETISDIVADIRAQNQGLPEDSYALSPLVCDLLSFADRIEAAAKREVEELEQKVAELRECLKEAIREKCPFTRMSCKHGEPCDYECGTFKWRKALQDEGGAK